MLTPEEFQARLREGAAFAPSLIGLDLDVAAERARERGFETHEIPEGGDVAIPLSLAANRIWLIVDARNHVVRALAD